VLALARFFKRYNKAVLDKAAIDREQARLAKENEGLRQLLKSFLDGISVNDAVINSPANPLLVVNHRLQATLAESRRAAAQGAAAGTGMGDGGGASGAGSARAKEGLGSGGGGLLQPLAVLGVAGALRTRP
jgi:hypothetical protein